MLIRVLLAEYYCLDETYRSRAFYDFAAFFVPSVNDVISVRVIHVTIPFSGGG